MTLSGGECTMFPVYVESLARALKQRNLHVLVETAGEFDGAWFVERLLPLVDLVYFDVKLAETDDHRLHTGSGNRRIWENLSLLLQRAPDRIEVRIPLVPGITATHENLTALGKRLRAIGVRRATLLPYNPLGREMAARLGRECPPIPEHFMTKAELAAAIAVFEAAVWSPVQGSYAPIEGGLGRAAPRRSMPGFCAGSPAPVSGEPLAGLKSVPAATQRGSPFHECAPTAASLHW